MKTIILLAALFVALLIMSAPPTSAFDPGWRINTMNNPAPGFVFIDWSEPSKFFLLDHYGEGQYSDSVLTERYFFMKLLKNGLQLAVDMRQGMFSRRVYLFDENKEMVDSIPIPEGYLLDMHDAIALRNGRYLLLLSEERIMDLSEITDGGFEETIVFGAVIVETDNTGEIYWIWKAIDHMDIRDATEDVELRNPAIDFNHANSLSEFPDGSILLSSRHLDELTKISRPEGDVLWRMGGSMCENNEFQFIGDTIDGFFGFSHQHSASVLENGNILLFDNGCLRPDPFCRAVEYRVDEIEKTTERVWQRRRIPDLYNEYMGSAVRLENGNTLINWISGIIEEITPDDEVALEIEYNPDNSLEKPETSVYRAVKIKSNMDAVTLSVNTPGSYDFSDDSNETGASIAASSIEGGGLASLGKYRYSPPRAQYSTTEFSSIFPARWVLTLDNIDNISGTIKIKTSAVPELQYPEKTTLYKRNTETSGVFQPLTTVYRAASEEIWAEFSGDGEFVMVSHFLESPDLLEPFENANDMSVFGYLTWSAVAGASSYQVQISDDANFQSLKLNKTIEDAALICAYSKLRYEQKYYWRVRAINSKDVSEWSSVFFFKTRKTPTPEIVFPPDGFVGFKEEDFIEWKIVPGDDLEYDLIIASDAQFKNTVAVLEEIDYTKTQMDAFEFNKKYFWKVRARQSNLVSEWTKTNEFTTTLAAPEIISPAENALNMPVSDYLSWSAIPGAQNYSVEIAEEPDFVNLAAKQIGTASTVLLYNLENEKTYFARARAQRSGDTSDWSPARKFETLLAKAELVSPENGKQIIGGKVELIWTANPSAANYSLQISTEKSFNPSIVDTAGLTEFNFTFDNISLDKKIYWRIKARNGERESDWTPAFWFIAGEETLLEAPSPLSPADGKFAAPLNGTLLWNPSEGARDYDVEISTDETFLNKVQRKNGIENPRFEYSNLLYNQRYYWRARANSGDKHSVWSAASSFVTELAKPELISPANGSRNYLSGDLFWSEVDGSLIYRVQISTDSAFTNNVADEQTEDFYWRYALEEPGFYFWRVKATSGDNYGKWSAIGNFIVEKPASSIGNEGLAIDVVVFPNPAYDKIFALCEVETDIEISDAAGKKIFDGHFFRGIAEIDLSEVSAGVYYLRLESKNAVKISKILIMK